MEEPRMSKFSDVLGGCPMIPLSQNCINFQHIIYDTQSYSKKLTYYIGAENETWNKANGSREQVIMEQRKENQRISLKKKKNWRKFTDKLLEAN